MNVLSFILSLVAFVQFCSPLSRDFAANMENPHNKPDYKGTLYPHPSIGSAFSLQNLARSEREIYKKIRLLLHNNSSSVNVTQVGKYVKDYEDSAMVLAENFESHEFTRAVTGNVGSVYRMIRRFRNFIQVWMLPSKTPARAVDVETMKALQNIYRVEKGPRRIDFQISMLAFAFLQFHFDFKAHQIAEGIYNGRATGVKMKAIHCLEIGLQSMASGFYPIGIEWIEHALDKVNQGDATVNQSVVKAYLDKAILKHDAHWRPFNEKDMVRVFYEKTLNQTTESSLRKWRKTGNYSHDFEQFGYHHEDTYGVCKGDIKQREIQTSKLLCWYESSIHPSWKIGPLKSELLTPLPDQIIQFHDVIGDALTEELRKASEGKFIFSLISKLTHLRLQFSGSMSVLPNSIEKKLENLAGRLSGLHVHNQASAGYYERFDVASYVPGGFTTQHVDWSSGGIRRQRLATLIIHLERPEMGGSTGFPRLKMAATAIKGSAILWFNVNSAGEHATNTVHGSCPLVLGSKWIATKWISYVQQSHLKCDVNKNAGVDYRRIAR